MGQSRKGGGDNDRLAVCDRIHNRKAEENCNVGSPCARGYFDAFGVRSSLLLNTISLVVVTEAKGKT
jgi:hypothetical protein